MVVGQGGGGPPTSSHLAGIVAAQVRCPLCEALWLAPVNQNRSTGDFCLACLAGMKTKGVSVAPAVTTVTGESSGLSAFSMSLELTAEREILKTKMRSKSCARNWKARRGRKLDSSSDCWSGT